MSETMVIQDHAITVRTVDLTASGRDFERQLREVAFRH